MPPPRPKAPPAAKPIINCVISGCGFSCNTIGKMVQHTRSQHSNPRACGVGACTFMGQDMRRVAKHRVEEHGYDMPFKCHVEGCAYATCDSGALSMHANVHTGARSYPCKAQGCDNTYTHPSSLLKHTKTHTDVKKYVCTDKDCGHATHNRPDLVKHMRAHSKEKPYQCEDADCGRFFSTQSDRAMHMRAHKKPFKCEAAGCDYAASKAKALEKHKDKMQH